jgi:hypothetical protein
VRVGTAHGEWPQYMSVQPVHDLPIKTLGDSRAVYARGSRKLGGYSLWYALHSRLYTVPGALIAACDLDEPPLN